MTNQSLANPAGSALASQQKNPFEAYAEAVNTQRIVGELLKFSKGDWTAGQDGREVHEGTEMVANMDELMVGWIKWQDNKPVDMIMGKVADGYLPPKRDTLGDIDKEAWDIDDRNEPRDPWQLTNYLILMEQVEEGEAPKLYTFATSSKGGMGAIGKLCAAYGKRVRQKPDEYPVIALNVGSYKHSNKAFGKIYFPEFAIVGWTHKAEFGAALAGEAAANEAEEEAPVAPPPAPVTQAAPAPRRGRPPNTERQATHAQAPTQGNGPNQTRF